MTAKSNLTDGTQPANTAPTRMIGGSLLVLLLIAVGSVLIYQTLPRDTGVDWYTSYHPASLSLLRGESPYAGNPYFYPPWALIPVLPLALLDAAFGRAVFTVMGLASFSWIAYKLGARPLVMGAFLLSPPVLDTFVTGNMDWMVFYGLILPPQVGLFFLVIKPQIGALAVLYWMIESWRVGGIRQVVHIFWPVALAVVLSLVLYGPWYLKALVHTTQWWNASLWPASIPIGLFFLVRSLRQRSIKFAMIASPFLSPYVLLHAWSGAFIVLVNSQAEFFAVWAGLWILVLIRAFGITI